MTDSYAYWRNALAGNFGPVHDGDAQNGFYRKKGRDGAPWLPAAIFDHEGEKVALLDGKPTDPSALWSWVCDKPVTEAAYNQYMEGKGWPDDDPTVTAQMEDARRNSDPARENEVIRDQIESAKAGASAYAKITDDETLSKAQSLRSRLLELKGEAEKKHKTEKEPHLKAGRAVDAKWLPLARDAETAAGEIKAAMSGWETEKLRRRREEERKSDEARRKAEEDALAAEKDGKPAPEPVDAPEPAPAPVAPTPIRGSYGRAASVAVVNVVTGITDQAALYEFLKDHPEVKELFFTLAKRAVAKGHTVPGVSIEEQAKVA